MNIQKMMQQAQQMQERLQKQMGEMTRRGHGRRAAWWPSPSTATNRSLAVQLDPEVVSKDDVEMLQDLIVAAINDAHRKVDEALASQMQGMMGGLKIPGLS